MSKKAALVISLSAILILALGVFATAYAQLNAAKPYEEGQAGRAGNALFQADGSNDKPYAEGQGGEAAGARIGEGSTEERIEGEAGKTGRAQGEGLDLKRPSQDGLTLLYRFSGVTDDGQQGSTNRKEATSIHCTSIEPLANNQVEVMLYQWNGTDVFTGTVNMTPNRTFTFSTQNTTIYFEDVILGGIPGTDAISQGSGQIWSETDQVICTAEVLDPLNNPPEFATSLELFQE